jgi:hypothetical protein
MHVPIIVKSLNNISKWQMGFNSAVNGLIYLVNDFVGHRNLNILNCRPAHSDAITPSVLHRSACSEGSVFGYYNTAREMYMESLLLSLSSIYM